MNQARQADRRQGASERGPKDRAAQKERHILADGPQRAAIGSEHPDADRRAALDIQPRQAGIIENAVLAALN